VDGLYLAELLEIDSDEVNVTISFDRWFWIPRRWSVLPVTWWLGWLDPTLHGDYPTIESCGIWAQI